MSKRLILKILFKVMMLTGVIGFIGGGLIGLRYIDTKSELPLSLVNTIQTDSIGNIYLGLEFYGYIQKYSSTGKFIKNWKLNSSHGGAFYIRLIENEIYAYTGRGNSIEKYDLNGSLINKKYDDKAYEYRLNDIKYMNNPNCTCEISGFINRQIECKNQRTHSNTIIKMSYLNQMLRGPIPAWLFAFIGFIASMHFDKRNENAEN